LVVFYGPANQMLMLFLDATPPTSPSTFWFTLAATAISLAAVIFGFLSTRLTLRANNQKDRKSEIYKILNDLYGPFNQLRQKSSLLYDKFKIGKAPNHTDGHFSTLLYLLAHGGAMQLDSNDQAILKEIIEIGNQCEKLIYDKAGLIDDEALRLIWLPKAATHYLIIRLAYQGALNGHVANFTDSTFPQEIDALLEIRIEKLHEELGGL
jgi:hypothetical protein